MKKWSNRIGAAFACASVCALAAPFASAAVTVSTSGGAGTFAFVDGVSAAFPLFGGTFETLIGSKSFTGDAAVTHTVTVPFAADFHFTDFTGSGLRWVETVTNNSAASWSGFTIALDPDPAPPVFYPDSPTNVPTFVTLTGSGAGVTSVLLDGPVLRNGWTISQNAPDTSINVSFASDLLDPGESFSIYFALTQVPVNQPFSLTEAPVRVPEPATLALVLVALAGSALALRRTLRPRRN